ncbi:MAG: glycosyltransferase, partial [Planctomycetota bacterium]|nr:glycosyltransferase [Planctomycetota bacterium]
DSCLASRSESPADHGLRTEIERALAEGRRPGRTCRERLQKIRIELALRQATDARPNRLPGRRFLRHLVRNLFGRPGFLLSRTCEGLPGTRVLHAIGDLQVGGAQQLVVDLARSAPDSAPHSIIARSIQLRYRPGVRSEEIATNREAIRRAFDRHRPRLLHLCHYHASPMTRAWYWRICEVATEVGVPIVQTHCVIGEPLVHPGVRHLVFCSDWSRTRSGLAEIPDSVIHPGSPLELFSSPRRPLPTRPTVGMVYRLDGDKIDETASEAIVSVLRHSPAARMAVVGDGPVRPRIQATTRDAGFGDRIRWTGSVPFARLPEIHRSFDLEIAPVVADTFGSGSVHAIAAGTPVVGYDVGALPMILRNRAALCEASSPEDLGRLVAAILDDDSLHAETHAAQLAHARESFGLDRMCRSYHELFARLARPVE